MIDYPLTYASTTDIERRRLVNKPLFDVGRIVATPGALQILDAAQVHPLRLVQRHQLGDWGEDLNIADRNANDTALVTGGRLLSAYRVDGLRLWILTECVHDFEDGRGPRRNSTCVLTPDEY